MRRRFGAEPAVQATEPCCCRSARPGPWPWRVPPPAELRTDLHVRDDVPPVLRRFRSPHDPTPRTHLLSNGRYAVMMTAAGSGYSRWRGPRRDAMARGHDPRPLGNLRLPGRRRVGPGLVGGVPAGGRRARLLRSRLLGRPRRDPPHATA